MSVLQFTWTGDLDENKSQKLQNPQALFQEKCHPMLMIVKQEKKETRIGRKNSKMPPDYALESAVSNRMISRNHVTIERLSKGNYMLYDHSLNGTYVNYCRVIGGTILKNDDVVCFGHINGANIKPGESVTPFSTDLKYRVEIIERVADRSNVRCENFSDSSDEDDVPKNHTKPPTEPRKRQKLPRPHSDVSGHSSDSSDVGDGRQTNSYVKRKKAQSSSSEDDRLKQSSKDRPTFKKGSTEKPPKQHSSSVVARHSDSARKRKAVIEPGPPKGNYQKKSHESKRPRPIADDDRRPKDRASHHKGHQKSKYSDHKSAKRTSNVNYDYEECSAQPCLRPDGENLIDWIMCDKCNQWFHQFCVGLDEAVEDDDSYYCPYCANE